MHTRYRSARRRSVYCALLMVLLAVAGCTPAPEAAERSQTIESLTLTPETAWSVELDLIGQPQVAQGIAVVHVRAPEDRMHLVAFDVETGKKLWRTFVAPSWGSSNRKWEPVLVETRSGIAVVAYVEPSPDELSGDYAAAWSTSVVVADAKTGKELTRSPRQTLDSRPSTCSDGTDLCYTELPPGSDGVVAHRIVLDDAPDIIEDTGNPLAGFEHAFLADGVYLRYDSRGEYLGRIVDGKKLWEKHLERFVGEGYDPYYGYSWLNSEVENLLILSVERSYEADRWRDTKYEEGDYVPRDLGSRKQVAINTESGEIMWASAGRDSRCLDRWGALSNEDEHGKLALRCVYDGTGTYDSEHNSFNYSNLQITVERFDPLTGETKWSHEYPVKDPNGAIDDLVAVRGNVLLTASKGNPALLDVTTGEVTVAEPDMVFACAKPTRFTYRQRRGEDYPPYVSSGGGLFAPCDAAGDPVEAELSLSAVTTVGQAAESLTLVGLEGRLVAFKTPAEAEPETTES
ncbi:outer membrane protein assembly factor BamB [Arthrobacter pigmenti]|uniref:Outer membrane protein assembly factor BamB n=1 Tax=Arthrobacter pigmenti TaxID=271432 RepID=A0A846RL57_9MICC|nr:hypothetical protein [Arthrobacter pigmenti]NJC24108.1 outer membrane protein assembly factor BamB [Arthrobacter pigmenti]